MKRNAVKLVSVSQFLCIPWNWNFHDTLGWGLRDDFTTLTLRISAICLKFGGWYIVPWSRTLFKMAMLSQFLHVPRNFEILHDVLWQGLKLFNEQNYMIILKVDNIWRTIFSSYRMTNMYKTFKRYLFSSSIRHVRRLPLRLRNNHLHRGTLMMKNEKTRACWFIYEPQSVNIPHDLLSSIKWWVVSLISHDIYGRELVHLHNITTTQQKGEYQGELMKYTKEHTTSSYIYGFFLSENNFWHLLS